MACGVRECDSLVGADNGGKGATSSRRHVEQNISPLSVRSNQSWCILNFPDKVSKPFLLSPTEDSGRCGATVITLGCQESELGSTISICVCSADTRQKQMCTGGYKATLTSYQWCG